MLHNGRLVDSRVPGNSGEHQEGHHTREGGPLATRLEGLRAHPMAPIDHQQQEHERHRLHRCCGTRIWTLADRGNLL